MAKRHRPASQAEADDLPDVNRGSSADEQHRSPLNKRQRAAESVSSCSSPSDHDDSVIVNLTSMQKPQFSMPSASNPEVLRNRLRAFLPELAKSNAGLKGGNEESLEHIEGDGTYISMDLGLGVLEQVQSRSGSETDDSDSMSAPTGRGEVTSEHPNQERPETDGDDDVMLKLMGSSKERAKKPDIQELITSGD